MNENSLLLIALSFGYAIAPLFSNHFFLKNSKVYSRFHLISFLFIILAIFFKIPQLSIVWPIFCGVGSVLFCKTQMKNLFLGNTWMGLLPFGFSFLSAIWFYSGQNQYYLLGYNETWSYYAALHGCFIGWLFLSGIIFLSEKNNQSKINPIISLSIVFLFLLIAYGIYGNPILKKIGVIGYSFLMPFSLLYLGKFVQNQNFISQLLRRSSIVFLSFTLLLALLNEFYQGFPNFFYGYPFMIILHGYVNAFIVIPCFLGSLLFEDGK